MSKSKNFYDTGALGLTFMTYGQTNLCPTSWRKILSRPPIERDCGSKAVRWFNAERIKRIEDGYKAMLMRNSRSDLIPDNLEMERTTSGNPKVIFSFYTACSEKNNIILF